MTAPVVLPQKEWLMKTIAYFPIFLLFGIFTFLYISYLSIYLVGLLSGSYDLGKADVASSPASTAFVVLNTMTLFTNQIFQASDSKEKGIVYAILLHIFALLFWTSAFRAILTDPGKVTDTWNQQAENELNKAILLEKKILRKINKRNNRLNLNTRQNTLSRIRKELESDSPEAESRGGSVPGFQSPGGRDSAVQTEGQNYTYEAFHADNKLDDNDTQENLSQGQGQGAENDYEEKTIVVNDTDADDDVKDELLKDREEYMLKVEGLDLKTEGLSEETIHQYAVMSAVKRSNRRFCAHCQKFKPERAHHCRQCGICVLKMDHHCPWVNNCIGFFNYKYFINLLFWADISLLFIWLTFTEVIQDSLFNPAVSIGELYFYLIVYLVSIAIFAILVPFLCFHIWLISMGKTTLEFCEKKHNSHYDAGIMRNFVVTLGPNPLTWFLPICPNHEGGGVKF